MLNEVLGAEERSTCMLQILFSASVQPLKVLVLVFSSGVQTSKALFAVLWSLARSLIW